MPDHDYVASGGWHVVFSTSGIPHGKAKAIPMNSGMTWDGPFPT